MAFFGLKIKNAIRTMIALIVAAVFFLAVSYTRKDVFPSIKGERTYYLYSRSSNAAMEKNPSLADLFFVRGVSVQVSADESISPEKFLADILQEFSAQVVLEEKVLSVTSYYAYSERLGRGVVVGGKTVNLHVAVSTREGGVGIVVGTPIIFGGY